MKYPRTTLRSSHAVGKDIKALLETLRQGAEVALHLGCGGNIIPGVINCDLHNPAADRKLDSTDLSEFADGSVDLIENHHMLEHLSFQQADAAIGEWARALRPGGLLIITCPDLNAVVRHWLLSSRRERWEYAIQMIYGSQEHDGMFHRSGYDRQKLEDAVHAHSMTVEFSYAPYPRRRTPSMLVIARKNAGSRKNDETNGPGAAGL